MNKVRKVVAVPYDATGNLIEGDFNDCIIGEAETLTQAVTLTKAKGFTLIDFDAPDNVPGELIGELFDAFAVGVIST